MGSCLAVISKVLGHNIDGSGSHMVPKSKKNGALWVVGAVVCALAVATFAMLAVVGASLSLAAFISGAGVALGVFQLFNTITNIFFVVVLVYATVNCIKMAQYHLGGKKAVPMNFAVPFNVDKDSSSSSSTKSAKSI